MDSKPRVSAPPTPSSTGGTFWFHRHWAPIQEITEWVATRCQANDYRHVLEIGPGMVPFAAATEFVGCHEKIDAEGCRNVDIDTETLPFDSAGVDFVYCRHVLEDIQNPDFAMKEILRVSKHGGYVETPSPLVEATKQVDACRFSHLYCGYLHHRYLVWGNMERNELFFLPKYSSILDHVLQLPKEYLTLLNESPVYWNNYFWFDSSRPPTVVVYKNGVNFNVQGNTEKMVSEYVALVARAIEESIANTDAFCQANLREVFYRQKQETMEVLQSLSP